MNNNKKMSKKQYTINLLRQYFKEHCLHDWSWRLNNRRCGGGVCKYHSKYLEISRHYISSPNITKKDIHNTILHELAHILTQGHGHDEHWRKKFIELGGNGKIRCKHFSSFIK